MARRRVVTPELMDDPALPAKEHDAALRGLARVNWVGGSARVLWPTLRRHAQAAARNGQTLSVLDVATGSGDIPCALAAWGRKAGFQFHWHAADISRHALERARERAARQGFTLHTRVADVTRDVLGAYDIVICSTFLHHLQREDARIALAAMAAACSRALIVADLCYSRHGVAMTWLLSRAVTRSRVVWADGPISVRNAFTLEEFRQLARDAGLDTATVRSVWGSRMLLEWQPSQDARRRAHLA